MVTDRPSDDYAPLLQRVYNALIWVDDDPGGPPYVNGVHLDAWDHGLATDLRAALGNPPLPGASEVVRSGPTESNSTTSGGH